MQLFLGIAPGTARKFGRLAKASSKANKLGSLLGWRPKTSSGKTGVNTQLLVGPSSPQEDAGREGGPRPYQKGGLRMSEYHYLLTFNCYEGETECPLIHKNKFTPKQFIKMYNVAIATTKPMASFGSEHGKVIDFLVAKYGFKVPDYQVLVHAGNYSYRQIPLDKVTDDTIEYNADDYYKEA